MARTASISIRVTPDVRQAAERAAAEENRSIASLAERLLKEFLRSSGYLDADMRAVVHENRQSFHGGSIRSARKP